MGLGKALGVKTIKLKLHGNYADTSQLFSVIQELDFRDAGSPLLVPYLGKQLIVWPEIDRQNQVQISGKNNKFILQRSSQPASGKTVAKNLALSAITDGWSDMTSLTGKGKNICMGHVDLVAKVISEAGI